MGERSFDRSAQNLAKTVPVEIKMAEGSKRRLIGTFEWLLDK
jgi:hypothetical protein